MRFQLSRFARSSCVFFLFTSLLVSAQASPEDVLETLRPSIAKSIQEAGKIPAPRQKELKKAAAFIRTKIQAGEAAQLTFICTHNSRRSHLAQIWTQTAAAYYGVEGVQAFSGGTEATAMNIRTVRALRRSGFSLVDSTGGDNPVYLVQYGEKQPLIKAYSKVYSAEGNPRSNYAAIMTCSQADKNCPVVEGSTLRVAIPYEDPKEADGKPEEVAVYDERSQQIAREMFFLVAQIKG